MRDNFFYGIEELRNKLIDISRRNKLINYKKPPKSRYLKIIDESAEFIFNYLIKKENSKFKFKAIPEPNINSEKINKLKKDKEILEKKLEENNSLLSKKEREEISNALKEIILKLNLHKKILLSAEERAKELGFNTSDELPEIDLTTENIDNKYIDDSLQTLHYPNEMEKILKNIKRNARSIIEETGSNMLYLILGVLEWQETDYSDNINKSPLITIPVILTKTKLKNKYFLEYSGEGLETNRSLAEKLLSEFGIVLPELTEEMSFSDYIKKVKLVIKDKKRWRIKQEIALDFLHFGKILMYQDLKEDNWENGLFSNSILQDIFIGKDLTNDSTFAPEYDIDNDEVANAIPLVMDADSSQHSAIVDVIKGKNVIIEGPPGTGKSQTIANIIAALMAEGKSILFVSEKLAALEVVYKRLESVGLGDFCLELHSHKSKKTEVLQSIKKRLDTNYLDIVELNHTIKDIEHRKKQLQEYVNILNQQFAKIEQPIYNIFWQAELYRNIGEKFIFDIPKAKEYTHSDLNNNLDELEKFKNFHKSNNYNSFFWKGLDLYKLNFTDIDNFLSTLDNIKKKCKILREKILAISYNFKNGFDEIEKINSFIKIFQLPKNFDSSIFIKLNNNINDFKEYINIFNNIIKFTQRLDKTLHEFEKYINYNLKLISSINILEKEIKNIYNNFNIPKKFDIEFINLLIKIFGLLEQLNVSQYKNVSLRYGTSDFEIVLTEAQIEQNIFKEHLYAISKYTTPAKISDITFDEIEEIEYILESKKNSVFNVFSSEYKKSLNKFQNLLDIPLPDDKNKWTKIFKEIKKYIQVKNNYNYNVKYTMYFGNLFNGINTNWDEIIKLNEWSKTVRNTTNNMELVNIILSANEQKYNKFLNIKNTLESSVLKLKNFIKELNNYYNEILIKNEDKIDILELKHNIENLNDNLNLILEFKNKLNISSLEKFIQNILSIDFKDIEYKIKKSNIKINNFNQHFDNFVKQGIKFKNIVYKINNNYDLNLNNPIKDYFKIKDTQEAYNAIINSDLNKDIKQIIFKDFDNYKKIMQISKSYEELLNAISKVSLYGDFSKISFNKNININSLTYCINKLEKIQKYKNTLSTWIDLRKITHSLINLNLYKIVEWSESNQIPIDKIEEVFKYNFYNTLIKEIFNEYPLLNNFNKLSHEQLIKKYKELDKKLILQYRKKVAYLASKRNIPTGHFSNIKSELSELSLIKNEINKKKKHIPIRKLISKSANAIQGLKPCFMMSPLSVSQYLPPNDISFDVLIIDEASQLRPEEALGSIARAKQIVIVGDPKQLPPTSFFNSIDKSDDNETVASESESILDIFLNIYRPIRQLRWHYRSQHESLIDFSNQYFYDGNLLVFPSPTSVKSDTLGIKYHYIENAVYQNRRNKLEAKIIIEQLEKQMKKYPNLSIGIGTFNSNQRDLIQDMVDEREKKSLIMANYLSKWKDSSEAFFIKNLENLQGDERDVIFISTTYGKDKDTRKVYQRFGPINSDVGWRRLNVMITRAKQKMEIFTSIKSNDIIITEKSSRGVRALKEFLYFLETSKLTQLPKIMDRGFDSEFEESVYKILNQVGYEVVPQVGVAGYFIDLAVVSESNSSDFILGIECDGATYHSSKSARDRDRLRQEVLERLGWNIYRIWSVDWYKNRENEISKLIKAVREAQKNYTNKISYIKSTESIFINKVENNNEKKIKKKFENKNNYSQNNKIKKSKYTQQHVSDKMLKDMLVELRDTKIAKEFNIDSKCLLSDLMIEQFLKYKPLNMDEFRSKIPLNYRNINVINIEQMKFMPYIFEILELADE